MKFFGKLLFILASVSFLSGCGGETCAQSCGNCSFGCGNCIGTTCGACMACPGACIGACTNACSEGCSNACDKSWSEMIHVVYSVNENKNRFTGMNVKTPVGSDFVIENHIAKIHYEYLNESSMKYVFVEDTASFVKEDDNVYCVYNTTFDYLSVRHIGVHISYYAS